jgi:hypothetical protein
LVLTTSTGAGAVIDTLMSITLHSTRQDLLVRYSNHQDELRHVVTVLRRIQDCDQADDPGVRLPDLHRCGALLGSAQMMYVSSSQASGRIRQSTLSLAAMESA